MTREAIVAGAGIAGLAAALALAQRGWAVDVWERTDALGEVGAGLQMSPNAMKVLRALGVEDKIVATAFEPVSATLRDYRTGQRYLDLPLKSICRTRYGAPYFHVHRADLHDSLLEAALRAGVGVRLATPVTQYRNAGARVEVEAGGLSRPADLLIGADGIRSAVRTEMNGPEAPRFTGQVAWRAVVPVDRLPAGTVEPNATVWVGPGRHLVTYLLRGGTLANIVAVEERADWRDESWTTPGDPADLCAAFSGWHPTIDTLLHAVDQTFLWALFDRPLLPRWHDGRAVLIGDACHPTLPFMAQGAAMGLEDALVLARFVKAASDVPGALARFETTRKPRTSRLQAKARANARFFHLDEGPGGLISRAKLAISPVLPSALALRPFDWIYGYEAAG